VRKPLPRVSILMATCGGEEFIGAQLRSIVAQSYGNYELLVSDDASTDATFRILSSYAARYDWIRIHRNNERLGVVRNFESLLESAGGEYIAFCDQDDLWYPDKLSRSVELMESGKVDGPMMLHSDLRVVDSEGRVLFPSFFEMRSYRFSRERALEVFLGRCGAMGNTMLINQQLKSLVLPFPETLAAHDYWIALVNELFGKRITVSDALVDYRIHDRNSSNTLESIQPKRFAIFPLFKREYHLPFRGIRREETLAYLLERYPIGEEERKTIHLFMEYLRLGRNRLSLASLALRHDFFRDNRYDRLKTAWKILWAQP